MNIRTHSDKGFTLIEVLVVLGIISLLASVVLFSSSQARQQARDNAQKTNLTNLKLALDLFAQENGHYPIATGASCLWYSNAGLGFVAQRSDACPDSYIDVAETVKLSKYLERIPNHLDSKAENCRYGYYSNSTGSEYKVLADRCVENETVDDDHPFVRCPSITCGSFESVSYAIYSQGASNW